MAPSTLPGLPGRTKDASDLGHCLSKSHSMAYMIPKIMIRNGVLEIHKDCYPEGCAAPGNVQDQCNT
jgi:hypothetical protein